MTMIDREEEKIYQSKEPYRQKHKCRYCGAIFYCSEHCEALWRYFDCMCANCDGADVDWKRKCDRNLFVKEKVIFT